MIITDVTLRKLSPSEGMRLTNGEVLAEGEVYLGKGDSPDNWHEITEEEYQKAMAERDAENADPDALDATS